MLKDDIEKYTNLTGEDGWHVPIMKVGAYLDGYNKALEQAIDKMQELEDEDIEAYGCSIPEGFDGKRAIEALKALPSIQKRSFKE